MNFSRFVTAVGAVALLAVLVGDVSAQDERPGGRRGGGGFRGGPGPGGMMGSEAMSLQLLRMEPVRTELQISPAQEDALGKLSEQLRGERPDVDFRSMSEEERREFFEKRQKEMQERATKLNEQLEEVLLPEQLDRLQEIELQLRGVQALNDDKIAAKLNITEVQKTKMREVQEKMQGEMREKMREIFSGGGGDRDAMREAFTKAREEMESAVLGVLNSDQQKKFEEMKGEAFEMPEGFGRGGRGRGPGGEGRGGRGFGNRRGDRGDN